MLDTRVRDVSKKVVLGKFVILLQKITERSTSLQSTSKVLEAGTVVSIGREELFHYNHRHIYATPYTIDGSTYFIDLDQIKGEPILYEKNIHIQVI